MKLTAMIQAFLLLALSSLVLAASLPDGLSVRRDLGDNTNVGPMKFKGEIGGHYLELEGTLQEVYAQAQKLFPDIEVNFTTSGAPVRRDDNAALKSRQVAYYQGRICWPVPGQSWGYTWQDRAADNYVWLALQGNCCAGPGPGNCVRTSCSYNTAIQLCNDQRNEICVSCSLVAEYAADISQQCLLQGYPPSMGAMTGGQEFSYDGWNVILNWDNSCP